MKFLSKVLIVVGLFFVFNATGNDDLFGMDYSLFSLFASVIAGAVFIAGGALLLMRYEK